jgi:hypothetical protein
MSLLVIDASVGIKWFVPEVLNAEALRLRHGGHELHGLASGRRRHGRQPRHRGRIVGAVRGCSVSSPFLDGLFAIAP